MSFTVRASSLTFTAMVDPRAAAAAALEILDDERLVAESAPVGAAVLRELDGCVERYPFVGHGQDAGLFSWVELAEDETSEEPLPRAVTERIGQE